MCELYCLSMMFVLGLVGGAPGGGGTARRRRFIGHITLRLSSPMRDAQHDACPDRVRDRGRMRPEGQS
jgi:hypothetical protein